MLQRLTLHPIQYINGTINLPGSKSISNRALLLAAMAKGNTKLVNLLKSDDVQHMLKALTLLGVKYQLDSDETICQIEGLGRALQSDIQLTLFLGNAGTAMRPLTAALSLITNNDIVLTGEERMKERPIGHLVDALRQGGSKITYLENEHYPPLKIHGGFSGGTITIDGSISSQYLTALLMAAPLAQHPTHIYIKGELVSKPYIDITLKMMADFGVQVENDHYQHFFIARQSYTSPGDYLVEGDASSASYFLAAAAIRGGKVRVNGVGKESVQGDIQFANVLAKMGATLTWGTDFIECQRANLHGIDMDMNHIPDAAMTIATTALFAQGETVIRNIYNWRVKETDRLAAMAAELKKVGAMVEEGEDYLRIRPPKRIQHAEIMTYNDHRMAMCFSLIALSESAVTILDPNCTTKTFPDYFQLFAQLSYR